MPTTRLTHMHLNIMNHIYANTFTQCPCVNNRAYAIFENLRGHGNVCVCIYMHVYNIYTDIYTRLCINA